MKKIDILIPNFEQLGAQRVAINAANVLKEKYQINFVVFEKTGPFAHYLDKNIPIIELNNYIPNIPKIRVILRMFAYYKYAKKNQTDVAISFSPITNFAVIFAKIFHPKLKTIIQAHDFPSSFIKDRENVSWLSEIIFKYLLVKLYNISDIFITSTEAIREEYIQKFGIKRNFFKVVRNPIDIEKISQMAKEEINDFQFKKNTDYLIGAGRLSWQKNFKRLIDIFSIVKNKINNVELIILGEGPLKEELEQYAKSLKINQHIYFLGFKNNPDKYIAQADIFCLTSNWEALPQIIAEAMICKTIVIANDCKAGPSEMIQNNETGFLIEYENIDLFAQKIIEALQNKKLKNKLEENAYNFASREYSLNKYKEEYERIIKQLL